MPPTYPITADPQPVEMPTVVHTPLPPLSYPIRHSRTLPSFPRRRESKPPSVPVALTCHSCSLQARAPTAAFRPNCPSCPLHSHSRTPTVIPAQAGIQTPVYSSHPHPLRRPSTPHPNRRPPKGGVPWRSRVGNPEPLTPSPSKAIPPVLGHPTARLSLPKDERQSSHARFVPATPRLCCTAAPYASPTPGCRSSPAARS